MVNAVGGNFPYLFKIVDRPDAVAINNLPAPPRASDFIQFDSKGATYMVTGITWTPNDNDAVAQVRIALLDDDDDEGGEGGDQ